MRVEEGHRRASEEHPAARARGGVDRGESAGDCDRAGGDRRAGRGAAGDGGQLGGKADEVGEAGAKPTKATSSSARGEQRDDCVRRATPRRVRPARRSGPSKTVGNSTRRRGARAGAVVSCAAAIGATGGRLRSRHDGREELGQPRLAPSREPTVGVEATTTLPRPTTTSSIPSGAVRARALPRPPARCGARTEDRRSRRAALRRRRDEPGEHASGGHCTAAGSTNGRTVTPRRRARPEPRGQSRLRRARRHGCRASRPPCRVHSPVIDSIPPRPTEESARRLTSSASVTTAPSSDRGRPACRRRGRRGRESPRRRPGGPRPVRAARPLAPAWATSTPMAWPGRRLEHRGRHLRRRRPSGGRARHGASRRRPRRPTEAATSARARRTARRGRRRAGRIRPRRLGGRILAVADTRRGRRWSRRAPTQHACGVAHDRRSHRVEPAGDADARDGGRGPPRRSAVR